MLKMDEIIGFAAKQLVDHPEEVRVSMVEGNNTTVFELRVAKEDIARVTDKDGHPAGVMRTILNSISYKISKHAVLHVLGIHTPRIGYRTTCQVDQIG